MLLHHAPKHESAFAGDAPLGSTAIAGTVDTVLLVRRRDQYRTLTTVQRCGEDLPETVVTLDEYHCPALEGSREDYEIDRLGKEIVEYLDTQKEPVDEKTIHDTVEGRKGLKAKALRKLVKGDKPSVVRSGEGVKGSPYLYTKASQDSGFLVPPLYLRNQKTRNEITP
jgi:hypothetical protein